MGETANLLSQLITTVGFPIAACVALYYYMLKLLKANKDDNENLRKEHRQEINELVDTLSDLKEVIIELRENLKK